MDAACLAHCLSDAERESFEADGYLIVADALPAEVVERLTALVDALDLEHRPKEGLTPYERLHLRDFLATDELFLELLDWPTTFPKVWGILGWHIQLYLSHVDVTPPEPPDVERALGRLQWHQDSGRLNVDIESDPRPRISIKVGYFLTDTTAAGKGNFYILPGSHLQTRLELPSGDASNPAGAIPVCVAPGTAVIFDRRLWHSRSPNFSDVTRKAIFYGYSYRWLRPRDNTRIEDFDHCRDPIRRQLLGATHDGHGYTSPADEDVPLKFWIAEHLGEEAVAR